MAGSVGFASSLVTLSESAYKASKSLHDAVSSFKSQRQTIKYVLADLDSLVSVVTTIYAQAQSSQRVEALKPLWEPLNCCAITCQEMREALDACTARSKDGHANVQDWLKMQYHGKSFDDMKNRLTSYKSTLIIAFESINIHNHGITQDSLRDIKDLMSGTKEDLEDQLDRVRQTITTTDASLRETLHHDQARLRSCLESIAEAQRVADETLPKVIVKGNEADSGSRTIYGTDTPQLRFDLTVAENKAAVGALQAAGVHSTETLQALLGNSRTPDLALVLQALQTQSQSTSGMAIQSILHTLSTVEDQGLRDIPPEANILTGPGTSEYEDRTRSSELPRRSVGSMHGDIGNDGRAFERLNQ